MEKLRQYFIAGLAVVAPIFITVYVLVVIFRFADGILGKFINVYLKRWLGFYIPGIGFIISISIIVFIGFLTKRFIGRKLLHALEQWFSGLPLIKKIYPALKQIVAFIVAQKENFGFKKVVLAEFPSKGIWSIGFLTNENFIKINEATAKDLVAVFIPSTPGPLTGFTVFVPKEEIKLLDISVSDALKIIISGAVYKPIG